MSAIVVMTAVGDEEQALLIARELVARRLAACVNVLPGVRSVFRWQGRIQREDECLLLVKTLASERDAVAAAIRELHGYELPEILTVPAGAEERFLAWIRDSVDRSQPAADGDGAPPPHDLDDTTTS